MEDLKLSTDKQTSTSLETYTNKSIAQCQIVRFTDGVEKLSDKAALQE